MTPSIAAAGPARAATARASVLRVVLAALVLAIVGGLLPALTPAVVAATPELTIAGRTRYVVEPQAGLVRVTAELTATNRKPDTAAKRFYFDRTYLAVLPGTTGFTVAADGSTPRVSVSERTDEYTLLLVTFGKRLFSGTSLDLRLGFDLPDPGGAADRDVRVDRALVAFPAWAIATDETPGASVEVVFPPMFTVTVAGGELDGPLTGEDGSLVYRSGELTDPLGFAAYVIGDRAAAYGETTLDLRVGGRAAPVVVRSWVDDPAFAERIGDGFGRGLPALGEAIGLPYPRTEPLIVQEGVSRTLGGYAGLYDPASGRIDVDYAASDFVVLHEAAHVWFNGGLLADRWASEAFASWYAAGVANKLGLTVEPDRLTPELEAVSFPLNAWGAVGDGDEAGESYGYAAALALAEAIAARAGETGLRDVWVAADARESAYRPAHAGTATGSVDGAPDWRGLLDLLEERTGRRYDDLWRTWVARPDDIPALDARGAARMAYADALAAAGDWELPAAIRAAMTAWRFDEARGLLGQAVVVLALRDEVEAAASAAGLVAPATLREAFEGDAGLRAADAEARAELDAIAAIVAAAEAREPDPGPLGWLGRLGSDPAADLASAATAFAAGDVAAAIAAADRAQAAWSSAADVGIRRGATIVGALLFALLAGWLTLGWVRSRRDARAVATADAVGAGGDEATPGD